jgi:hypothetical protein
MLPWLLLLGVLTVLAGLVVLAVRSKPWRS